VALLVVEKIKLQRLMRSSYKYTETTDLILKKNTLYYF